MKSSVIMHINYYEQGQTIARICHKAVSLGFDGVEFRRKRVGKDESVDDYLDEITDAVKTSGLKEVVFGYPTVDLMTDSPHVFEKEIEEVADFFRRAGRRIRISVCNAFTGSLMNPDLSVPRDRQWGKHGSFIATEDQYRRAADGLRALGDVAQEMGFRMALETHMGYIHDLPESAMRLVNMVDHPAVGVNLDYGNLQYFEKPHSLRDAISLCGDRLYYVHLKNSIPLGSGERLPTALSEGEINHREYLQLLTEAGFDCPICIEASRPGDREWHAQQDIAYFRSLISDI